MKLQIIDNGLEKHGEVLRAQISRRIPAAFDGGMPVTLAIDPALGAESYRVDAATSGWQITGGDPAGFISASASFCTPPSGATRILPPCRQMAPSRRTALSG